MQPIKFTINGNTPSKKSSQVICFNKKTGSRFIKHNEKYTKWVEENPLVGIPCVSADDLPVYCAIKFFRKSKHKFDFINVAQSVMDLLVDRAVIPDDNADVVTPVFDGYEYDKDNPRCEVVIYN